MPGTIFLLGKGQRVQNEKIDVMTPRSLPILKISNARFYINSELSILQEVNRPTNIIPMDSILTWEDDILYFEFNVKKKKLYTPCYACWRPLPKNVKAFEVCELPLMDPVGLEHCSSRQQKARTRQSFCCMGRGRSLATHLVLTRISSPRLDSPY